MLLVSPVKSALVAVFFHQVVVFLPQAGGFYFVAFLPQCLYVVAFLPPQNLLVKAYLVKYHHENSLTRNWFLVIEITLTLFATLCRLIFVNTYQKCLLHFNLVQVSFRAFSLLAFGAA